MRVVMHYFFCTPSREKLNSVPLSHVVLFTFQIVDNTGKVKGWLDGSFHGNWLRHVRSTDLPNYNLAAIQVQDEVDVKWFYSICIPSSPNAQASPPPPDLFFPPHTHLGLKYIGVPYSIDLGLMYAEIGLHCKILLRIQRFNSTKYIIKLSFEWMNGVLGHDSAL